MRSNVFLTILVWVVIVGLIADCEKNASSPHADANTPSSEKEPAVSQSKLTDPNIPQWIHPRSKERLEDRERMVAVLKQRYEMTDETILQIMQDVPRHWFVPASQQRAAYADSPLPIGHGQTISQPFIVATMTQLLELTHTSKVLEIGTGSGYQAAVLSEFTPHVYTIEIVEPLGTRAMAVFAERGYRTIISKIGDGYKGWPEHAPFDAVIVTCAPDHIPQPLIDQLKPDGKIIIPVGQTWAIQDLLLATKNKDGLLMRESKMPVRFVPLVRDRKIAD